MTGFLNSRYAMFHKDIADLGYGIKSRFINTLRLQSLILYQLYSY